MNSFNPFAYRVDQLAKALAALVTSVIGMAGLIASLCSTGPLVTIGHWAVGVAFALAPVLVFLQRAERIADVLSPLGDPLQERHGLPTSLGDSEV